MALKDTHMSLYHCDFWENRSSYCLEFSEINRVRLMLKLDRITKWQAAIWGGKHH